MPRPITLCAVGAGEPGGNGDVGWRDGERFRRGMWRPYRTREIGFGVTWEFPDLVCDARFGAFRGASRVGGRGRAGWGGREPMEAAKWVGALPEGRLRSSGALVIARGLVESDPEMAREWLRQAEGHPERAGVQAALDAGR